MEQVDTLWGRALWRHVHGGHPNYEKDKRAPVSKIETKDDDMDMDTGKVRINNRINRYTRTRTG